MAKKYIELKNSGNNADFGQLATSIINLISLQSLSFPFKKEALSSDGTTTHVYENRYTVPELCDFLGEPPSLKGPVRSEARNSCQAK